MDDSQLPPIILPEPPKEPEKLPDNVIPLFSNKTTEDLGVTVIDTRQQGPVSPQNPQAPPPRTVIRLTPKQVAEITEVINQAKSVWMRRAACSFERSHNPKGCSCNYCVYINMMSKRVFDLIQQDIIYQMQRGKMVFCGPDMVEILQLALERVIELENAQTQGPPTK